VTTVEPAALAASLGAVLRSAGVPVTPEHAARFTRALGLLPPAERAVRDRVYWTARVVFLSAHEQVAAFDRVFAAVFDGVTDLAVRNPDVPPVTERATPPLGLPAPEEDPVDGPRRDALLAAASREERLRSTSFSELTADELVALRRLLARLALAPPPRRTRRTRSARRGEHLDLRRTLHEAQRTGGDPVRLARRRRRLKPRRLVLLCDVSASMAPYSRAFLQLLHAGVAGSQAEAFVFATRLTRLTRALRGRHPDAALARAAATAPDWSGGTRIGDALKAFLDAHGRRGLARGAVVVVVSDGWERGDPAVVAEQMARLARLAYRIVWVNPRKVAPGYAPLVGGMAAALPHCGAFVSGHSLAALDEVVAAITAA
jgi:uncharacterized protein with von Willebrand factor type A (vWA) domain